MSLRNRINRMINPHTYSSEAYLAYLKKCGVQIGEHCHVFSPKSVNLDVARPYLLKIGNEVVITAGVTILTHDYSHTVIRKKYGVQIGDAQGVEIGNNVFIGRNAVILMGTTIGNDVIIGAHAVVRGKILDNSVVAGNPATVVCTLEQYYQKWVDKEWERAVQSVRLCRERLKRDPSIEEMGSAYAWMYLPRTQESIEQYPAFFSLPGENRELLIKEFLASKPKFNSYEEFLNAVGDWEA